MLEKSREEEDGKWSLLPKIKQPCLSRGWQSAKRKIKQILHFLSVSLTHGNQTALPEKGNYLC